MRLFDNREVRGRKLSPVARYISIKAPMKRMSSFLYSRTVSCSVESSCIQCETEKKISVETLISTGMSGTNGFLLTISDSYVDAKPHP